MKRRNRENLEEKITITKSKRGKAIAYYELGVFHDNNSREKESIPNYLRALKLGLNKDLKSKCLAWLASSLYKTNKPKEALKQTRESYKIADKKLQKFLINLEQRIKKHAKRS